MVKILVFDTETTGLPPQMPGSDWNKRQEFDATLLNPQKLASWDTMLDKWPSIIQLSYILYDMDAPENSKVFNKYIDIPDNVVISEGSAAIHHITREKISTVPEENRSTIQDALTEFLNDVKLAEIVVGHNVQFDRKMVVAELLRLSVEANLPQIKDMMDEANFECTMIKTTPMCNLKYKQNYTDKITGQPKFFYKIKSPKLSEAYTYFFGYEPAGDSLHDALVDVIVCLRVFCKYKYSMDVCGKNTIITDYIKRISPQGYKCPEEMVGGRKKRTTKKRTTKKIKTIKPIRRTIRRRSIRRRIIRRRKYKKSRQ